MKNILCLLTLMTTVMADNHLEKALKTANDQFTAKMFQEVVKAQGDKSVVLSAFSVLSPLAVLSEASLTVPQNDILRTIGFPNIQLTREVFKDINKKIQSVKGVELRQASNIYIRIGYTLKKNFATISKNVYGLDVQNIDFSANQKAAKQINTWVEDNTNKRIKDLVNPNSINGATVAILVNAIYFKGTWQYQFNKNRTKDGDFYVSKNKKVSKPMMSQTGDFLFGFNQKLDAKVLVLPYVGNETSLVLVLPNKIDGINDMIMKLKDLFGLLSGLYYQEVRILLPKFKIETTTDLKTVLINMNLTKLFSPIEAKLNNLLNEAADLSISDATQKAFIEVNEEGAEAAAANQFGIAMSASIDSTPRIQEFIADHPFAFFLMYKQQFILFNGVVRM